jgi:hypothetical protein
MHLRTTVLLSAAYLLVHSSFAQAPGVYKGKDENLPQEVAPQPIPFSHAQHTRSGITCLDCHAGADKKEQAGLPDVGQCMLCHQRIKSGSPAIERLAAMKEAGEKIKWVRVYEVPDFVFFSHASHVKGRVECESCHGPVDQREVLVKEVSTNMTACMNCHASRDVPNHCHSCHSLGQ